MPQEEDWTQSESQPTPRPQTSNPKLPETLGTKSSKPQTLNPKQYQLQTPNPTPHTLNPVSSKLSKPHTLNPKTQNPKPKSLMIQDPLEAATQAATTRTARSQTACSILVGDARYEQINKYIDNIHIYIYIDKQIYR